MTSSASVVALLLNPLGRSVETDGMTNRRSTDLPEGLEVECSFCPRVLDAEKMLRLDITMPGESRSHTHWLCPPDAMKFRLEWTHTMLEAVR